MLRRFPLLLLLAACATTRATLVEAGKTCASFAAYDARARAELDALMHEAPGETLVKETARLNAARRACARHVLSGLRERREAAGIEAVQRELDALAAAYDTQQLEALVDETLGPDALQLRPLLAEARLRATRDARSGSLARRDDAELARLAPNGTCPPGVECVGRTGAEPCARGAANCDARPDEGDSEGAPQVPLTLCAEASPCAQVDCIVEREAPGDAAVKRDLVKAAQQCLDTRAEVTALARLVHVLEPWGPNGASTEALARLEAQRRAVWPQVERAVKAGQAGYAAQLAAPFADVPPVRAEAQRLRAAAKERHLARAKETASVAEATWLHLALAESFGADAAPALGGAGRWDTARWRCPEPKPVLPALPAGLDAKVNVRCETPPPPPKDDSLRTFELRAMRVQGTLTFTCAGKSSDASLRLEDPSSEGFPEESFRHELEQRVATARAECARRHQSQSTASCTELRSLGAADILRRFVTHARFTHQWEPCFTEWLLATEGAQPPRADFPAP